MEVLAEYSGMLELEGLSDYLHTYIINIYNIKFIKSLHVGLKIYFGLLVAGLCWLETIKSAKVDLMTTALCYLPFGNVRVISAAPFTYATVVSELSTADDFSFPLALEPCLQGVMVSYEIISKRSWDI